MKGGHSLLKEPEPELSDEQKDCCRALPWYTWVMMMASKAVGARPEKRLKERRRDIRTEAGGRWGGIIAGSARLSVPGVAPPSEG